MKPHTHMPKLEWWLAQAIVWLILLYGCVALLAGCQAPLRGFDVGKFPTSLPSWP